MYLLCIYLFMYKLNAVVFGFAVEGGGGGGAGRHPSAILLRGDELPFNL